MSFRGPLKGKSNKRALTTMCLVRRTLFPSPKFLGKYIHLGRPLIDTDTAPQIKLWRSKNPDLITVLFASELAGLWIRAWVDPWLIPVRRWSTLAYFLIARINRSPQPPSGFPKQSPLWRGLFRMLIRLSSASNLIWSKQVVGLWFSVNMNSIGLFMLSIINIIMLLS